jgi:hypothetical protein
MRLRLAKSYVAGRYIPGEWLVAHWWFKNCKILLQLLINVNRNVALKIKRDGNSHVVADSCWEMIL